MRCIKYQFGCGVGEVKAGCFWNNTHPTCAAVISAPGGGKGDRLHPWDLRCGDGAEGAAVVMFITAVYVVGGGGGGSAGDSGRWQC